MKKIILVLLCISVFAIFAACNNGENGSVSISSVNFSILPVRSDSAGTSQSQPITSSDQTETTSSGQDGSSAETQTDEVLGSLKVVEGSEDYLSVSGNTVTVKKTCTFEDFKGLCFDLTDWSFDKGNKIAIKIVNSSNGVVSMKYKVFADGVEQFGYPDPEVSAGEEYTYYGPVGSYNNQAPSSVTKIVLFIGSTVTGSFDLTANLYYEVDAPDDSSSQSSGETSDSSQSGSQDTSSFSGQGGSSAETETEKILSALKVVDGSEGYFSVSGNTVTVKNTCTLNDYKGVYYDLTGWSFDKGNKVSIKIVNSSNGVVSMKYKAFADGIEQFGYPDPEVSAGEEYTYYGPIGSYNNLTPSNVTKIVLFFGSTAKGSFTVKVEIYYEEDAPDDSSSQSSGETSDSSQSGSQDTSSSSGQSGSQDTSSSSGQSGSQDTSSSSGQSGSQDTSSSSGQSGSQDTSSSSGQSGSQDTSSSSGQSGSQDTSSSSGQSGSQDTSSSSGQSGSQDTSSSSGQSGSSSSEEPVSETYVITFENLGNATYNGTTPMDSDGKIYLHVGDSYDFGTPVWNKSHNFERFTVNGKQIENSGTWNIAQDTVIRIDWMSRVV